jgi:hypothetical protein
MPLQNGMPIYSKPDAERAWGKLVALYKVALALQLRIRSELHAGMCGYRRDTHREKF